jgi:hypothetical protein
MTFAERAEPIFNQRMEDPGSLLALKELQARRDVDAFFAAEYKDGVVYHIQVGASMMLYLIIDEPDPRLIGVFNDYLALNKYIKENLV